ncbi:MAG: hypothetical protein JW395_1110 [Nitrospira sp.]|nr:hypothetical protein [Nitrospira sp.]
MGEKEDEKSSPRPSPVKASLWQTALTQWRRKESTLSQANARTIRKAVCDAVLRGLPGGWPGLPYPSDSDRRTIANKHTFIPRAGTGEAREGGAAIVICTEKDLRDEKRGAEIVLELLAVLEFHSSPDPWKATGDGGPVDFRRYAAFVRRHQDRAAKWLRENMTAIRPGDHFEHVVDGLLLSAALSNSWEGDESSLTDRMNNLLSEPTSIGSSDGEWGRLVTQAVDFGAQGRDALLKSFSAFQGTSGRTPLALDASALAPVVNAAGVGKIKRPAEGDPLQSEIVLLRKDLAEVLKNREARLIKWQGEATLFADQAFRDQLQELLTRTSSVGADVDQGGRSLAIPVRNGLHGLPEELQEIIASLDGLRSMPLTGKKIALISRISEDTLKAVEVASSAVLQYLAVAAPGAKQKLTLLESEDAQASLRELEATVDGIESALGDSTANGIDQHA